MYKRRVHNLGLYDREGDMFCIEKIGRIDISVTPQNQQRFPSVSFKILAKKSE